MMTLYLIEFYSGGSLGIEMYNVPEHGNNETYMVHFLAIASTSFLIFMNLFMF